MSSVVFVGNIPFEMSEEQVIDIFKDVGPVVSFRLMFDKETGKPRGYGFCEFADPETARSAIRNLNGLEIGGRTIKVDYADKEMVPPGGGGAAATRPSLQVPSVRSTGNNPLPPTTPAMETVMALLHSLDNEQLVKTITQLQALGQQSPEQARMLLEGNPALAYALFQAMLSMRLIDQTTINAVVYGENKAMPPVAPSSTPAAAAALDAEAQRQMLAQIMAMSEEQVSALPPAQRDQVRLIRSQLQPRK